MGLPSARISSKGALLLETHAVFRALAGGASERELKEKCLSGVLIGKCARLTRARVWDAISWRFFSWQPAGWTVADLGRAAMESPRPSPTFVGLVYLHYARRDHLTFDFVTEHLFASWAGGRGTVSPRKWLGSPPNGSALMPWAGSVRVLERRWRATCSRHYETSES